MFKLRSNMLPTVQMNFMSESEFAANLWTCSGCTRRDSQEHLLTCPGYADLRVGKNLEVDSDLVAYYRDIVKRRQDQQFSSSYVVARLLGQQQAVEGLPSDCALWKTAALADF